MLRVQMHVPDLVLRDADEAAAKLARRFGECEHGPGHELRRLQLVMKERVQRARPAARGREPACLARLGHDAKLGRTARRVQATSADLACLPGPGHGRRRHLSVERIDAHVVPGPSLDGSGDGRVHGREARRRSGPTPDHRVVRTVAANEPYGLPLPQSSSPVEGGAAAAGLDDGRGGDSEPGRGATGPGRCEPDGRATFGAAAGGGRDAATGAAMTLSLGARLAPGGGGSGTAGVCGATSTGAGVGTATGAGAARATGAGVSVAVGAGSERPSVARMLRPPSARPSNFCSSSWRARKISSRRPLSSRRLSTSSVGRERAPRDLPHDGRHLLDEPIDHRARGRIPGERLAAERGLRERLARVDELTGATRRASLRARASSSRLRP